MSDPQHSPSPRRSWALIVGANLLVTIAAWSAMQPAVPSPFRMLAAALLVLAFPGLGWLGVFRQTTFDLPRLALATIGVSSLVCVGATALTAFTVHAPSWLLLWITIVAVMNAGFVVGGTPRRFDPATRWGVLAAVALVAFVVSATAATRLVPPLEDHDMEVRGTAYGLASDFKPYFLTNREIFLPMAHPPLFHFHVAASLTLTGEIDAVLPSYRSARRAEQAVESGRSFAWMDQWRADHRAFVQQPALVGTRAPNALFSALVVALLCDVVMRMTSSRWAGIAAAVLYMTFPETVVRSAYAGYFSVTVFAMLAAAMLFDTSRAGPDRKRDLGWLAAAGMFAAWVDHKTVVLILAVTVWASLRAAWSTASAGPPWSPARAWRTIDLRAVALGAGFSMATFTWWGYALAVDSRTFVQDHLRMHIVHRFLLNDIRVTHDASRYAPSMAELWAEFAGHTGYLFVPVALAGIAVWLFGRRRSDLAVVLAAWVVMGSVLYTLTDWRQTKHLMNQLAPAVAAAVVLVWPRRDETAAPNAGGSGRRIGRAVAGTALVVALTSNLATDRRLIRDFESLEIRGASDVDGW